jgi:hypothetical protein
VEVELGESAPAVMEILQELPELQEVQPSENLQVKHWLAPLETQKFPLQNHLLNQTHSILHVETS